MVSSIDVQKLERAVKSVYSDVAERPEGEYHFLLGRPLAEELGYPSDVLDRVPEETLESFAGVGNHIEYADYREGDHVLDLGSGSGTDVFIAASMVGETGRVTGLDMTREQLDKSRRLRDDAGFENVQFERGYIEDIPFDDETFDVVISNGVINLSAQKEQVFEEARRVLKPDGRLAISDIISELEIPQSIKSNEDLWAACIGGAMQINRYTDMIEQKGFHVLGVRENDEFRFISEQAENACEEYGVKSISLGARAV